MAGLYYMKKNKSSFPKINMSSVTGKELYMMFVKANVDTLDECPTGELITDIDDSKDSKEYYAIQIQNIFDCTDAAADKAVERMLIARKEFINLVKKSF